MISLLGDGDTVDHDLGRAAATVDLVIDYTWGAPPSAQCPPSSPAAMTMRSLSRELPALVSEITAGTFAVSPVHTPLSRVQAAWSAPTAPGQRIVITPNESARLTLNGVNGLDGPRSVVPGEPVPSAPQLRSQLRRSAVRGIIAHDSRVRRRFWQVAAGRSRELERHRLLVNAVDVRGIDEPVLGFSPYVTTGEFVDHHTIKDVLILDGQHVSHRADADSV
jgi:hypothetical protein